MTRWVVLVAAGSLVVAGCGRDDGGVAVSSAPATAAGPVAEGPVGEGPVAAGPVAEAVEHVGVGGLDVAIAERPDGRYEACVTGATSGGDPDVPLCVGPHDGRDGPAHSWSQADRVGDHLWFLAIIGPNDSLLDVRFGVVRSERFPVAVAGGVLPGAGLSAVCSTYESGGRRYRYDTAVTASRTAGVSTGVTSCDRP